MFAVRKDETWWDGRRFGPYKYMVKVFTKEDATRIAEKFGGELEERIMRYWFSLTEKQGRKGFFEEQLDAKYINGLECTCWENYPGFIHPYSDSVLVHETKEYDYNNLFDKEPGHWLDKI